MNKDLSAAGQLLSVIWPQTIEVVESAINGPIEIQKLQGTYRVSAGGLTQSGGLVDEIWQKGVQYLKENSTPRNILVLGVGAGGVIRQLAKAFPEAKITGVELDSVMIDIANRYFGLSRLKSLKIVIGDAQKFIKNNHGFFDSIVVDLYLGDKSPSWLNEREFLKNTKKSLAQKGVVLINRLTSKEKMVEMNEFKRTLKAYFPSVERVKTPANYLFALKNHV